MSTIKCCRGCVAPKRYPGCHAHCPKYLEEKAKNDAHREKEFRERDVWGGIYQARGKKVAQAYKNKRH